MIVFLMAYANCKHKQISKKYIVFCYTSAEYCYGKIIFIYTSHFFLQPTFYKQDNCGFSAKRNMLYIFDCLKAQFYVVLISSVYLKSYHIGPEA